MRFPWLKNLLTGCHPITKRIHQKVFISLLFLSWLTLSPAADIQQQRKQYLAAQAALKNKNMEQFITLKQQLVDYPLYPYLVYAELSQRLDKVDEKTVQDFLGEYAVTPLAAKIRNQWIQVLAQREHWDDVLAYYLTSTDIELQCIHRQALLKHQQLDAAFSQLDKLWLTGHNLPESCNNLFDVWRKTKPLPNILLWQRIGLAIENQNHKLIGQLTPLLTKTDSALIKKWLALHKDPLQLTKTSFLKNHSPFALFITAHSLRWLADKDPAQAAELWEDRFKSYPFSDEQRNEIIRKIALSMASAGLPQATEWFSRIPAELKDKTIRECEIRTALLQENWAKVIEYTSQLPENERHTQQWQYWSARAHEERGNDKYAITLYQQLAQHNNYYGFLANVRLRQPIASVIKKPQNFQQHLTTISQLPAIQRAKEFYELGFLPEAREEWLFAMRHLKPTQIYAAAYLATQWGWYERAISTVAQTIYSEDLTLRFPLAYRDKIVLQAESNNLEPAWIFAIIRQESGFMADARSRVGALGLMQLMPGTAELIARQLKQKLANSYDILEINLNLRFGSHYLKQLLESYHGNIILASAAYNAGPGRVNKWMMQRHHLDGDIWIETIPWKETRNYVKNIVAYHTIYQLHLGKRPNLEFLRQDVPDTEQLSQKTQ